MQHILRLVLSAEQAKAKSRLRPATHGKAANSGDDEGTKSLFVTVRDDKDPALAMPNSQPLSTELLDQLENLMPKWQKERDGGKIEKKRGHRRESDEERDEKRRRRDSPRRDRGGRGGMFSVE
jgi:hypothetical protein